MILLWGFHDIGMLTHTAYHFILFFQSNVLNLRDHKDLEFSKFCECLGMVYALRKIPQEILLYVGDFSSD